MRSKASEETVVVSCKVPEPTRRLLERLAAMITLRRGRRCTMSEVVRLGIEAVAKKEGGGDGR